MSPTRDSSDMIDAGDARSEAEMAVRSFAFERLGACAVVLDGRGVIVDTNEAWRLFARMNSGTAHGTGPGVNYVAVCDLAAAAGVAGAAEVAAGLRQILAGEIAHLDLEYPCPSPIEDRWFLLQASAAPLVEGAGAVLFHVDVTARKLLADRLVDLAEADPLTGLPNRGAAVRIIETNLAVARRTGTQLAVMFLDLDGFKRVNDTLGHHAGDELLVKATTRMVNAIRETDELCRFGGDEFVVACPDLSDAGSADLVERLHTVIAEPFQIGPAEVTIGISVGVASTRGEATVDDLLAAADAEMYSDKGQHKLRRPR
jgi:diguanylate cyclase (GGDEF)-like protein